MQFQTITKPIAPDCFNSIRMPARANLLTTVTRSNSIYAVFLVDDNDSTEYINFDIITIVDGEEFNHDGDVKFLGSHVVNGYMYSVFHLIYN